LTEYFRIKNFNKFQHYGSNRHVIWIKFYTSILDNDDIDMLPDNVKAHLFGIWLLAARKDNKIRFNNNYVAKKINATTKVDLQNLVDLDFIELMIDANDSKMLATTASNTLAGIRVDKNRIEKKVLIVRIFEKWNDSKIICHSKISDGITKAATKTLEEYTVEEIIKAIENYGIVVNDEKSFFSYRWTLEKFLIGSGPDRIPFGNIKQFLDEANPLENFKIEKKKNVRDDISRYV